MITSKQLDTLTDIECIVLKCILKKEKREIISAFLNIRMDEVSIHIFNISKKLEIYPRNPQCIRKAWRLSQEE